jgi:hypothetical protein
MGHWEELTDRWYEQTATYCALTGQLIPRTAWVAEIEGQRLFFSDPECEQLYREYIIGQASSFLSPQASSAS